MSFFDGVMSFWRKANEYEQGEQANQAISQALALSQLSVAESLAILNKQMDLATHYLGVAIGAEPLDESRGRTKADLYWVTKPLEEVDAEALGAMIAVFKADTESPGNETRQIVGEVLRRALHAHGLFFSDKDDEEE